MIFRPRANARQARAKLRFEGACGISRLHSFEYSPSRPDRRKRPGHFFRSSARTNWMTLAGFKPFPKAFEAVVNPLAITDEWRRFAALALCAQRSLSHLADMSHFRFQDVSRQAD
jgi:hypothetical protein